MEMEGSRALAITQAQAWEALNNPEVLKASIPGCDKVEATGENRYAVGVAVKVGPLAARFAGKIVLADVHPPESYTLSFDGQGGAAGFGKGQAKVKLTPQGTGCELNYSATAQVGGKMAQVGQRLIDSVARSMAEDFFKRFDLEMQRLESIVRAFWPMTMAGDEKAANVVLKTIAQQARMYGLEELHTKAVQSSKTIIIAGTPEEYAAALRQVAQNS